MNETKSPYMQHSPTGADLIRRADAIEEKENDGFNTCSNNSNNVDADYKSHIRLIDANVLMDLLKARKRFFVDSYGGFHCMSEKDKARCDEIDACLASIVNAPTTSAESDWIPREHFDVLKKNYDMLAGLLEEAKARAIGAWIPCSERLPEAPTFCLVTTDGSCNDVIDIALYMSDGWHKASKILAWMPLPKPYREDGEV